MVRNTASQASAPKDAKDTAEEQNILATQRCQDDNQIAEAGTQRQRQPKVSKKNNMRRNSQLPALRSQQKTSRQVHTPLPPVSSSSSSSTPSRSTPTTTAPTASEMKAASKAGRVSRRKVSLDKQSTSQMARKRNNTHRTLKSTGAVPISDKVAASDGEGANEGVGSKSSSNPMAVASSSSQPAESSSRGKQRDRNLDDKNPTPHLPNEAMQDVKAIPSSHSKFAGKSSFGEKEPLQRKGAIAKQRRKVRTKAVSGPRVSKIRAAKPAAPD